MACCSLSLQACRLPFVRYLYVPSWRLCNYNQQPVVPPHLNDWPMLSKLLRRKSYLTEWEGQNLWLHTSFYCVSLLNETEPKRLPGITKLLRRDLMNLQKAGFSTWSQPFTCRDFRTRSNAFRLLSVLSCVTRWKSIFSKYPKASLWNLDPKCPDTRLSRLH